MVPSDKIISLLARVDVEVVAVVVVVLVVVVAVVLVVVVVEYFDSCLLFG